jgi:hypothetical protein
MSEQETRRKFNPLLALGILFLPIFFVWFLLRRGHSTTARIVGFGWLTIFLLAGVSANLDPATRLASHEDAAEQAASPEESEQQAAATRLRAIRRAPENFLGLDEVSGQGGGFNTVFVLSGRISNSAEVDIKDPRIQCELFGPSGTQVDTVQETLFEIVPAQGANRFSELNMGFMGSQQVATYNCVITDAEALTEFD